MWANRNKNTIGRNIVNKSTYHRLRFLWNVLKDWVPKKEGMTSLTNRSLSCTLKDLPSGNHEIGISGMLLGLVPSATQAASFCWCSYSHRSSNRWSFHGNRSCCATSGVGPLMSTPLPRWTWCWFALELFGLLVPEGPTVEDDEITERLVEDDDLFIEEEAESCPFKLAWPLACWCCQSCNSFNCWIGAGAHGAWRSDCRACGAWWTWGVILLLLRVSFPFILACIRDTGEGWMKWWIPSSFLC